MRASASEQLGQQISGAAGGFLRWWIGELRDLAPPALRDRLTRPAGAVVITVTDKTAIFERAERTGVARLGAVSLEDERPETIRDEARRLMKTAGSADTVLRLPASAGLRRSVNLPAAARENLREVLSFEMDRITPFAPEDVYFDFRVREPADADRLQVDVLVAPRANVEPTLEQINAWGIIPDRLEVADSGSDDAARFNLLPPEEGGNGWPWSWRLSAGLAVCALLLFAAAIYLPLYQKHEALAELETRVAQARDDALEAEKLKQKLVNAIDQSRFLLERDRARPSTVALLDETTRLLPDGTWLLQFALDGTRLTLAGYSVKATALIGTLETSDMLSNVQFRSPVTHDPRVEAERFNLSAEIATAPEDEARE